MKQQKKACIVLLLILSGILAAVSGCTGPSPAAPSGQLPVFSNGSSVTDDPWISMNPVGDQKKDQVISFSGSTSLPARHVIEVLVVRSGPPAGNITTVDDCISQRQKCALFFGRVTDGAPGPNLWNIRTDESMDVFQDEPAGMYTAIIHDTSGTISARTEFGVS